MRYDAVDFKLTPDGDIALFLGDIAKAQGNDLIKQQVKNRLIGSNPSWFYDRICADLEQFLGHINNRATADRCIERIIYALSKDLFLPAEDIYVKASPTSPRSISFYIFINSPHDEEPLSFEVSLDLTSGTTIRTV